VYDRCWSECRELCSKYFGTNRARSHACMHTMYDVITRLDEIIYGWGTLVCLFVCLLKRAKYEIRLSGIFFVGCL